MVLRFLKYEQKECSLEVPSDFLNNADVWQGYCRGWNVVFSIKPGKKTRKHWAGTKGFTCGEKDIYVSHVHQEHGCVFDINSYHMCLMFRRSYENIFWGQGRYYCLTTTFSTIIIHLFHEMLVQAIISPSDIKIWVP